MSFVLDEVRTEVVVVGAGVGGIAAAIKLKEAGITDFVVLERESDAGGTWHSQRYPGLTIDIPSLTYSYSFAQNPNWSSIWAPGEEMRQYCLGVVERFGVRPHFEFGVTVKDASYDEERNEWVVSTESGRRYVARYLINASGFLSQPKWPEIAGLESFEGLKLHTSAWPSDLDLSGKRVAFIGTGATAIQLVPEIVRDTAQLHVFQRTPIWLLPKPPMRLRPGLQRAFARVPGLQKAARLGTASFMDMVFFQVFGNYPRVKPFAKLMERVAKWHVRKQVDDPAVQRSLIPSYSWGCKRPSFSNDFYPVFNRPDAELVTSPIERVTASSVVTADGVAREVDVVVCATGYQPFERSALPTYPVVGRGGVDIQDYWEERRYQAYRGFAVNGYPNFFLIFGPYSIASSSYIAAVELAVRNVVSCLCAARSQGADLIEVRAEEQEREFQEILSRKPSSIWQSANCGPSNTYYVDRHGDTATFRPSSHPQEWWAARQADVSAFDFKRMGDRVPA